MADLGSGRTIFESLIEYPLPENGVKDYVFYFVPEDDKLEYGRESRKFFDTFYKKTHVKKENIGSLEELIDVLHTQVTAHGVQKIREIVIVAHGSYFNLLHKLVNDTEKVFKYIDHYSLAVLQRDMKAGKFPGLKDKRKKVIAHLSDDSWVTVRACNFGNSANGLYALYSFFGGRANVYAPKQYQFFGTHRIMEGSRLESRQDADRHLLKQHFYPSAKYSPERRGIILDSLLTRAEFSEPFELASIQTNAPSAEWTELLNTLNSKKINSFLSSKFQEHDFELNKGAKLKVQKPDREWVITDVASFTTAVTNERKPFQVQYAIKKVLDLSLSGFERAAFLAQAHVVDTISVKKLPFQLFLSIKEYYSFSGRLCQLAYLVDPSDDPQDQDRYKADKVRFDEVKALLDGGAITAEALAAEFNRNEDFLINNDHLKLSPSPTVTPKPSAPQAPANKWLIEDGDRRYRVETKQLPTESGQRAHALFVYVELDKKEMDARRDELFASSLFGSDPDTPGVELPASLDRLSIEDLLSLIDYLRSPFKPGYSFYISQAQEALARKKGFRQWAVQNEPITDRLLVGQRTYSSLSMVEDEDKRKVAYDFDFYNTWREIKAGSPTTIAFHEDLFDEEDLAKKFKISDPDINARLVPDDEEPDSPAADASVASPTVDRQVHGRFFPTGKAILQVDHEETEISCNELRDIIAAWLQARNLAPQEMVDFLEARKTSDGTSFLDVLLELAGHYNFLTGLAVPLLDIPSNWLPSIPTSKRDAVLAAAQKGIDSLIKWEEKRIVSGAGAFFGTRLHLLKGLSGALWAWSIIEIPGALLEHYFDELEDTEKRWELVGKLTAMRQWLRQLEILTRVRANDFPDRWEIDISLPDPRSPLPQAPLAINRYFKEIVDEFGRPSTKFVFAPDRMKAGYDAGMVMMEKVADEIHQNADAEVSDLLLQSGLEPCKLKVLTDAGMLDVRKLKALIVRHFARDMLDRLPKITP